MKDGYKLELQMPETKKLIDKIKNGKTVSSIEVAEIVLVQCNLVDNRYHINKSLQHYTLYAR